MISFNQIITLFFLIFLSNAVEDTYALKISFMCENIDSGSFEGDEILVAMGEKFHFDTFNFQDEIKCNGEITKIKEDKLRLKLSCDKFNVGVIVDWDWADHVTDKTQNSNVVRNLETSFKIFDEDSKVFDNKFIWNGTTDGFVYKVELTKLKKYEVSLADNKTDSWGLEMESYYSVPWKVKVIEKNKQGDKLGIKIGDYVTEINGVKIEEIDSRDYDYLQRQDTLQICRKPQEKELLNMKLFQKRYSLVFLLVVILFSAIFSKYNW